MATPDDLETDEFKELDDDLDDLAIAEGSDATEAEDAGDDTDDGNDADNLGIKSEKRAKSEEDEDNELDDDEEPDEEEESLDVILAREQDLEEEFAPSGEGARASPTTTPAGEGEFTCRSCFLVKRRAQLADEDELMCFDCV